MGSFEASPSNGRPRLFSFVLLVALVALTYRHAPQGAYVLDDSVRLRASGAMNAWSQFVTQLLEPSGPTGLASESARRGFFQPLSELCLRLGGSWTHASPRGGHWISLGVFLGAVALAYGFAARLARSARVGFFAALLFALHPLHVEAVAWISAVADLLAAALSLASAWAYLSWRERGSRGLPWIAAACLLAACLARESALLAPALWCAVDVGRLRGANETALGRTARWGRPLAAAVGALAIYLSLRMLAFGSPWAGFVPWPKAIGPDPAHPLAWRARLVGSAFGLIAWPSSAHPFREIAPDLAFGDRSALLGMAAIAVWLAVLAAAWKRRARPFLVGWLWIGAATLELGLPRSFLPRFSPAERQLTLGAFGAAFALSALLAPARRGVVGAVAPGALWAVALLGAWQSSSRSLQWRDEETLFRAAVAREPRSVYAQWNLGRVLIERARSRSDAQALRDAMDAFTAAQDLIQPRAGGPGPSDVVWTPDDALQANLGVANYYLLCALNDPAECSLDDAAMVFEETGRRFPSSTMVQNGLGVVRMMQGRHDDAQAQFEQATRSAPEEPLGWYHMGQLELRRQRWLEAADRFGHAAALQPYDAETLAWQATALLAADPSRVDPKAEELLARALAIDARQPQALLQRGMLELSRGDFRAGERTLLAALSVEPRMSQAHLMLGKLHLQRGDGARGVESLQRACAFDPRDLDAHALLGTVLADNGAQEEAQPYLLRALDLGPPPELAAELRKRLSSTPLAPR